MARQDGTPAHASPRRDVTSGMVIAISALAMVALMSQHPSQRVHETSAMFAEAVRLAIQTKAVHSLLLVAMAALVFGLLGFAQRLGPERPFVRLGAVACVLGAVALGGAGVLNGLVLPAMAIHFADRTPAEMEMAGTVLVFSFLLNQSLAGVGVVAWSVAVFAWSLVIVGHAGAWKWIGILGIGTGVAGAAMLLSGHLRMDVHGFGLFVLGQALWSIAVGITLTWASGASGEADP